MQFFNTYVSEQAIAEVVATLRSTMLSEGARVKRFESRLAEQLGLVEPVAVNSGTSALHLALDVAGVGPGDDVLLPPQTFVATAQAIVMQRARPVFVDINPATGNLCPEALRRAITPRSRAVMPVHWAGYPCDLDEINAIAAEHDLAVVEDAAHALGATYRGRPIGSISRFTAFSFQAIKHLTTGDGGALCCTLPADAQTARTRRWFGIDRAASQPSALGERVYDLTSVGYKYHLNDFAAALGLGNLVDFSSRLARRQTLGGRLRQELADVSGLKLLNLAPDRTHAYWLFTVLVERREAFVRALADRGVPASVVHQRIDRYTIYGGVRPELTGQAEFDARQVSLPIHEQLTDEDVEAIVAAVRAGW